MRLSPIQLRRHAYVKFSIIAREDYDIDHRYKISLDVRVAKSDHEIPKWIVRVGFKFAKDERATPYEGEIEVEGLFDLHRDFPNENAEQFVRLNAGVMLMGAIRESVMAQSSRMINGPLELPTLDAKVFVDQEDLNLGEGESVRVTQGDEKVLERTGSEKAAKIARSH